MVFIRKSYFIHEDDNLLYKVERTRGLLQKGYTVTNYQGDLLVTVIRKSIFGRGGIKISENQNRIIGDLQHKFYLGRRLFNIQSAGIEYFVKGNLRDSKFTIYSGQDEVGKVSRNVFDSRHYMGIAVQAVVDPKIVVGIIANIILNNNNKKRA